MATVAEAQVRDWMQKLEKHLRRYWSHPEWEEILATGYQGLAEGIEGAQKLGYTEMDGYVLRAGWNAVHRFLRSAGSWARTRTYYGTPLPQILSLDALLAAGWNAPRLVTPDFAPRLVTRLEAQRVLSQMPPHVQTALRLWGAGYDIEEIAHKMGRSHQEVRQYVGEEHRSQCAHQVHSGYRGVTYDVHKRTPWTVRYPLPGRRLYLGSYDTAEEAALVADAAALCYGHGLGTLNLLPDEYRLKPKEESSGEV